jgi:dGTPase
LTEDDIPKAIRDTLGRTGSQRIDRMVRDVVAQTLACDYEAIRMSAEVLEALEELRRYMFEHMYLIPAVRDELEKAKRIITALFEYVVAHPEEYLPVNGEETTERLAIDFIAGMTDRYAIKLYERLFVPRAWV